MKFNDADLLGAPLRVTVGRRGLERGEVELKLRRSSESVSVGLGEVGSAALGMLGEVS